jgi:hypothetical protein
MQSTVRLVLVEDDPIQAEWLVKELIQPALPHCELRYFDSEHSFLRAIETGDLQLWKPHIAIFDLLVCFYSIDELEEMIGEPDLRNLGKATEAGVRCRDALRKACPDVRTGIITVLDDMPDGFCFRKGEDNDEALVHFLKQPLN